MSLYQKIESDFNVLKDIKREISFAQDQLNERKSSLTPPSGSVSESSLNQWRKYKEDSEAYIQAQSQKIESFKTEYNDKINTIMSQIQDDGIWINLNDWIHLCKKGKDLQVYEGNISLFNAWQNNSKIPGTDLNKRLTIYSQLKSHLY